MMIKKIALKSFAVGLLCGAILATSVWAASIWYEERSKRSIQDANIYDQCLITQSGNWVACDALMRMLDRERIITAELKKQGAKMLAAGATKRDVVEWATKQGAVGSQISDAAGISLDELQSGKY